jgi:4-amino-4-deoxy-L-arabinose transferase-like glycosyltransferase
VLLTFFAALFLLPGLGRMAAHDTTDARYLEVAREMWASGDWLVPRLAGVPHLQKPPLTYWAACAGFAALGPTPFAGRLLEQAAVAATAVLVFAFAARRIGAGAAWIAAGVFLTSGLVFAASRALQTDLFQLLFLTAAMVMLYEGSAGSVLATAAAGGFLGASMLAKGPIALAIAAAVLVPFLVLRRGERRLPWQGIIVGAALFAAIGLPWFLVMVDRDPSLLRWFAERQVLARIAGGGEGHRHGLLYLPAHVLAGTVPWTPVVLLAAWRLRPQLDERSESLDVFLLLWAAVPCLLFELFATKLATYLLPALPATALLAARAIDRGLLEDRRGRRAVALAMIVAAIAAGATCGVLLLARGGAAPTWLERAELAGPGLFALALAAAGSGLLVAARAALSLGPAGSLRIAIPATGVALALGAAAIAPGIADHERDAELVLAVPGAEVIEYGVFAPGLLFYTAELDRFFVAIDARRALLANQHPGAANLGLGRRDVAQRVRRSVPTFVLAKRSHAARLAAELGLHEVRSSARHVLLANPAAAAALALATAEARAPRPDRDRRG